VFCAIYANFVSNKQNRLKVFFILNTVYHFKADLTWFTSRGVQKTICYSCSQVESVFVKSKGLQAINARFKQLTGLSAQCTSSF
jgi:hypothetical protein